MSMPGPTELILILVIIIVLFGARKLPEIGDSLGRGIRSFKEALSQRNTGEKNGSDRKIKK